MLDNPDHNVLLNNARPLLDSWNAEADYFRRAAQAARRGGPLPIGIAGAVRDTTIKLAMLLNQIEETLTELPAAHCDFRLLLWAQIAAVSLSQSISKSSEVLEARDRGDPTSSGQPTESAAPATFDEPEANANYHLFGSSAPRVVQPIVS
jgi:hypothetical protein